MDKYNPHVIEKKWQEFWNENKTFKSEMDENKEKFYALVEFPYPSGQGLHVGHPRPYTALDIVARKRRLQGEDVLYPMGWDAFGLPTENYAIKHKIHPADVTRDNVARFKAQLQSIGFSFDWDREINTTDPEYYKWTQWIFLKFFEKGLAYKKESSVNWCPSCLVGLANEEVVNGECERCGAHVEHKVKDQWMLKITEYADKLIDDLELVDYPEKVKQSQINWIGRSHGLEVDFSINEVDDKIKIYTTRPDTLYGSTFLVVSAEHPILKKYADKIENLDEIKDYQHQSSLKSDFERSELNKEKTGVEIKGLTVTNPVSKEEIPVWVSDYVLMTYGTGAVMASPAHDERDYEFANKFELPIRQVIDGGDISKEAHTDIANGTLINSGEMNGMNVEEAIEFISNKLENEGIGKRTTNYKLRDWVFSRQRYWGEPIPVVYCEDCGWVAVPEEDLPVKLPEVDNYSPTATGESPLSEIDEWVNTTCPKCGKEAKRETDTMPQWAGSSWYYLRYTDPNNTEELASEKALKHYGPVDWYNGGMEHTTLHLLYSRFWHKFLYDLGLVYNKEPYMKRTSHGMILGDNGEKMSKSRGNVINPDDIVNEYGADTMRTYEMFIGDFEKDAPWSDDGVKGCRRFLERVWNLQDILVEGEEYSEDMETLFHKTIEKVSNDYENLKYNTAIAQLMTLQNELKAKGSVNRAEFTTFLILLNPVAPHITTEIWDRIGNDGYIHEASWPIFDKEKTKESNINLPVQISGKMRGTVEVSADASEEEVMAEIEKTEIYEKFISGKEVVKRIFVPGKIVNIVVK